MDSTIGKRLNLLYVNAVHLQNLNPLLRTAIMPRALYAVVLAAVLVTPSRIQAQVVINEVMADNTLTLANNGLYPDWIELYNTSGSPVDVAGMSLTNFGASSFSFPANTIDTIIPAEGFLLVWCDSDTNAPGFHTMFGLGASGDGVALVALDGVTQVDSVTFGLQVEDLSIGRVADGTGTWQLNTPTPLAANEAKALGAVTGLSINEWLARDGRDWLELYNRNFDPVALAGLVPSDTLPPFAPAPTHLAITNLSFIGGLDWVQFFCEGGDANDSDELAFKLSHNDGETITLYGSDRATILDRVSYGPGQLSVEDSSMGRLPDGEANIVIFPPGNATPDASNFLPLNSIVINEVLSNPSDNHEGAIELHNTTEAEVDVGYWWLSNQRSDAKKFQIPSGTVIPAGGFKVFYEMRGSTGGYNTSGTGIAPDFALDFIRGDQVYLVTGDAGGNLTGFRGIAEFRASEKGVSLGRYDTSQETVFVRMSGRTFGADDATTVEAFRLGTGLENSGPLVGPLVISEVMYHPPDIVGPTDPVDDVANEYIEIYNISSTSAPLYDPANSLNKYRVANAVDYTFPFPIDVPAGGRILLVSFDPLFNTHQLGLFRAKYGLTSASTIANFNIFGPYNGKLANGGDTINFIKPGDPVTSGPDLGFVPSIRIDRVKYSDLPPWPVGPDGTGQALQRIKPEDYGDDVANWMGADPTPGLLRVEIDSVAKIGGEIVIGFRGEVGTIYSLQAVSSITSSIWNTLLTLPAQTATGPVSVTNVLGADPALFYRVVKP